MSPPQGRVTMTWEAPRWAKVESFVKDQAALLKLQCTTEVEKSWFSERGRVTVLGCGVACARFIGRFDRAIETFNKDDGR